MRNSINNRILFIWLIQKEKKLHPNNKTKENRPNHQKTILLLPTSIIAITLPKKETLTEGEKDQALVVALPAAGVATEDTEIDRKMVIPGMTKKLATIDGSIEKGLHMFPHEGRTIKMRHTLRQSSALFTKK